MMSRYLNVSSLDIDSSGARVCIIVVGPRQKRRPYDSSFVYSLSSLAGFADVTL